MSVSVCLSVCLSVREHISGTARPISAEISHGRRSVLLCRRCDTLCTSCVGMTYTHVMGYMELCSE